MRKLWLIAILAAATSPAQGASFQAPLEPAARGQVQCAAPNVERKTCLALYSYQVGPDGMLQLTTKLLVAPKPEIIMESTSAVEIKDGRVCEIFKMREIIDADFTMDGKPAAEQLTYLLRDKIEERLRMFADREACTTYVPNGALLKAEVSIDGSALPKLDQVVMWVSLEDGFRLGR